MTRIGSISAIIRWSSFLFLLIFLIYPVARAFSGAFVSEHRFSTAYFEILLSTPGTAGLFVNSFNLALTATLFSLFFALPLALLLCRYDFPGKALVSAAVLLPLILPPFVGAVGIRKLLARFGPINLLLMQLGLSDSPVDLLGGGSLPAVALTQALHLYPIMYLNLSASLSKIDPALEEAARNAGAASWPCFKRITLPLIAPGIFAGACLVFVWAFTDLGTPLVFDMRDLAAVQIFSMVDEIHTNPSAYALVTLLFLVTLAIFLCGKGAARTRFSYEAVRGSVQGGVKPLRGTALALCWVGLGILLVVSLLPHLSVLTMSVGGRWMLTAAPSEITFDYYKQLLSHPLTAISIRNSLVLSASSTILVTFLGLSMGYFIVRGAAVSRAIFEALSLAPLTLPGIMIAFGYLVVFSGTFLDPRINPMLLLMCGYAIRRLPFMVRAVVAGFQQSSVALEEAAQSVGAPPWRVFMRITLPLLSRHILAGAIVCFSLAMLEVSESLMLAMEERFFPVSKAMYTLLGRPDGPAIASALGVVGMVLIVSSLAAAGRLVGKSFADLFSA